MRILLIDKSDSELIEQALKQERIPLDRMQPSESDDSIVIPEDIYDVAILTASDIAYSRGARTCERITALREENAGVPLLVILPHPSAHDRANLLNAGADYVLSDPFADEELLAVLHALARRPPILRNEILTVGDLTFDRRRCTISSSKGEIRLSGKEMQLVDVFMSSPGQVISRELIKAKVWGEMRPSTYNSIEVYLTLLRRKFRSIGSEARICAERGMGYYLAD